MATAQTRIQHENARTWRWLLWLLLPGRALHELTHAYVGRRWAAAVAVDWRQPAVTFEWRDAPLYGVIAAHLAPFIVGYSLGSAVVGTLLVTGLWDISPIVVVWVVANWLYYSFPTRQDLSVLGL